MDGVPDAPRVSRSVSPLGQRLGHIVTTNRPCDSRDSISPSFDTYTNVLNDFTAIFRPIAVFMRVLCGFSRRALHSVELSRTRVAKAKGWVAGGSNHNYRVPPKREMISRHARVAW